jgi:hypothetical protein
VKYQISSELLYIIVEDYLLSPLQSVAALKDTLRELIDENNIRSTEELGIFQKDS